MAATVRAQIASFVPSRASAMATALPIPWLDAATRATRSFNPRRSEEHTSELQSQSNLVCRLLLEKKNNRAVMVIVLFVIDYIGPRTASPLTGGPSWRT